jgi:hypothetical protein
VFVAAEAASSLGRASLKPPQPSLLPEDDDLARKNNEARRSIDEWTNDVIQSGFDDRVLGRVLNE